MQPFFVKNYSSGKLTAITTEQDRLNYMFKNNLTSAPDLTDLEVEEKRGIKRKQNKDRLEIRRIAEDIYNRHFWGHVCVNHFKHKERFKTFFLKVKQNTQHIDKLYWKQK